MSFVPVEEYLSTAYRPGCDYVDGEILERNAGEIDHGRLQITLAGYLWNHENLWGIWALTEVRVQISPSRFRVPDITVVIGSVPTTRVLVEPPLLCIEILSPEDRMERLQERIEDYLTFGVSTVWVVNPRTRRGYIYTTEGMREAKDGILTVAGTPISVPIPELV
jgi:Uma2 family endonuclease